MRAATSSATQPPRDWFEALFGFTESTGSARNLAKTKERLAIEPGPQGTLVLRSLENGASYGAGRFACPSLGELRALGSDAMQKHRGRLTLRNELGDVAAKHALVENRHATFQVASQFNCLEFVGPDVVPEDGVTGYANDRTQGPACSIACGPGTVYRNYFTPVPAAPEQHASVQEGQSRERMIDNLLEVGDVLGNAEGLFFVNRGGYSLANDDQLAALNARLVELDHIGSLDLVRAALRVGVHEDVQVTATDWGRRLSEDRDQIVTQVFGSACAVAYNMASGSDSWQRFATIVLEASYEATLWAALLAAERHKGEGGSRIVFLTCLGGGVFGNSMDWIAAALRRACERFGDCDLDVRVVTYAGRIHPLLQKLEEDFPIEPASLQRSRL